MKLVTIENVKALNGKKCACTGQRPNEFGPSKSVYNKAFWEYIIQFMTMLVAELVEAGHRVFMSGGAQGADQVFFQAVEAYKTENPEMDVQNIVFVPFEGQENPWRATEDKYPWMKTRTDRMFSVASYEDMLESADGVVVLHEALTEQENANKLWAQLYNDRNIAMAEVSDTVYGFIGSDEIETFEKGDRVLPSGGTSHCLYNAAIMKREIQVFNALTGDLIANTDTLREMFSITENTKVRKSGSAKGESPNPLAKYMRNKENGSAHVVKQAVVKAVESRTTEEVRNAVTVIPQTEVVNF